jgi:hypothetical protein
VVKGFGREPTMLLTKLRLKRRRKCTWPIVGACLTRWRIEETTRFMKQGYQLEDIRREKSSLTIFTGGAASPMGRKTAPPTVVPAFLACDIWHNGFEISILSRADRGPFF